MIRAVRSLWERVTEPRRLRAFYAVVYAVTLLIGFATLLSPPQSIAGELGPFVTTFWAVLLVLGGFGGLLTVLPGWWWAERLSIWLVFAGLGIYLLVVLSLHLNARDGSSRLTQLGVIALASGVFAVRLMLTKGMDYEPRRR